MSMSKFSKKEFAKLKKWSVTISDEQLKKEYYYALSKTLSKPTKDMSDRGFDLADIREMEKFDRWLVRRFAMLRVICIERGIDLA